MTDLSIAHAAPPPAPFPWFGGKSKVAASIWERLGPVSNYVEPFFGSGAVLLQRPQPFTGPETINDADGFVANAWRAIARDPEAAAAHADWPINEVDLHARHAWLVAQRGDLTTRLMGDPDYFDAKIAGWWLWGICAWIGSGWCSGNGPWHSSDGRLVDTRLQAEGNAGQGINRKLPHLGDAGRGINRQLPHLGNAGRGAFIADWFTALSVRLRDVRVCCGDWKRVVTMGALSHGNPIGIFLDPPYDIGAGTKALEAVESHLPMQPSALVVLQCSTREAVPQRCGRLTPVRDQRYGDTAVHLYRLDDAEKPTVRTDERPGGNHAQDRA